MTVPWAPTQSPRSSSFTSSNAASPITPSTRTAAPARCDRESWRRPTCPCRAATSPAGHRHLIAGLGAGFERRSHSRTSASVWERSNRYGYGSSPLAQLVGARQTPHPFGGQPTADGSSCHDSLTTATVVGGLGGDTLRLRTRRSLAASCRVRPADLAPRSRRAVRAALVVAVLATAAGGAAVLARCRRRGRHSGAHRVRADPGLDDVAVVLRPAGRRRRGRGGDLRCCRAGGRGRGAGAHGFGRTAGDHAQAARSSTPFPTGL